MFRKHRAYLFAALLPMIGAVLAAPVTAQSSMGNMPGMKMDQGGNFMAMLAPPAGATAGPRGMVVVSGTAVQLTLSAGKAGDALPWHVHKGMCGDDIGVVDATGGWAPASIGADGKGAAKATLVAPLAGDGKYYAAVHASASDMKTIVACAPLKPGKM